MKIKPRLFCSNPKTYRQQMFGWPKEALEADCSQLVWKIQLLKYINTLEGKTV